MKGHGGPRWFVVRRTTVTMNMTTGHELRDLSYHSVVDGGSSPNRLLPGDEPVFGPCSRSDARSEAKRLRAASAVLET